MVGYSWSLLVCSTGNSQMALSISQRDTLCLCSAKAGLIVPVAVANTPEERSSCHGFTEFLNRAPLALRPSRLPVSIPLQALRRNGAPGGETLLKQGPGPLH